MSEAYVHVKSKKLGFKGDTSEKKKRKKKHKKHSNTTADVVNDDDDALMLRWNDWWCVNDVMQITGHIVIEINDTRNILALDTGKLSVGKPHIFEDGSEGLIPEEVFTAVTMGVTDKIALKSPYGRYVSTDDSGELSHTAEAFGSMEMWEPIVTSAGVVFKSALGNYMCIEDDGRLTAKGDTVENFCFFRVRVNAERQCKESSSKKQDVSAEELEHAKRFQSWRDSKVRVSAGDRSELKRQRDEGKLHEGMLDRRQKLKADRYCK